MKNSKPLYIFDLDGTLALIDHRCHYVENNDTFRKKDWKSFYAECVNDIPNFPVIKVMQSLAFFSDILIFSGRSQEVKNQTIEWLSKNTHLLGHEIDSILKMRLEGDYTPDDELKMNWLNQLSDNDRSRLVCVFDDRNKVVAIWRKNGVSFLQVADGEF